jgi:hypothetical protein
VLILVSIDDSKETIAPVFLTSGASPLGRKEIPLRNLEAFSLSPNILVSIVDIYFIFNLKILQHVNSGYELG